MTQPQIKADLITAAIVIGTVVAVCIWCLICFFSPGCRQLLKAILRWLCADWYDDHFGSGGGDGNKRDDKVHPLREDFETTRRKRAADEDAEEVMKRNKYHSAGHRYPKLIGKKEKKRRKTAHPIGPSPGNRALYLPRLKDERVPAITRGADGGGGKGPKTKDLGPLGGKAAITKVSRGAM